MKTSIKLLLLCVWLVPAKLWAQQQDGALPHVALKTNLLYWATSTPNIGIEVGLSRHYTLQLNGGYNAWRSMDRMRWKHYLIQPELRYWTCQRFVRHFWGIHGVYSEYNAGPVSFIPALKGKTYQGKLYGGGISYGYHLPIGPRWGAEFSLGVGYLRLDYEKYACKGCNEYLGSYKKNYFGPTQAAVSIIYLIN